MACSCSSVVKGQTSIFLSLRWHVFDVEPSFLPFSSANLYRKSSMRPQSFCVSSRLLFHEARFLVWHDTFSLCRCSWKSRLACWRRTQLLRAIDLANRGTFLKEAKCLRDSVSLQLENYTSHSILVWYIQASPGRRIEVVSSQHWYVKDRGYYCSKLGKPPFSILEESSYGPAELE